MGQAGRAERAGANRLAVVDVEGHWDEFTLQSTVVEGASACLSARRRREFWTPTDMLDSLRDRTTPVDGARIVFGGTVSAEGESIRYGREWTLTMDDPVLGRRIQHAYSVAVLGEGDLPVGSAQALRYGRLGRPRTVQAREGRTLVREVTRTENGRGDRVGDSVEGPWEMLIDLCRDDYSRWEHYTLACHWDAGAPHNRRMEGREVWRRFRTVTAAGETLGEPEFVSTSCWTGDALPPAPVPVISETAREETKSGSCPAGYIGSIGYRRTVTLRSTRFLWDEAPVTQSIHGAWTVASDGCVKEVEPDHDGPGHGDPGGPDGGSAAPGGDSCGGSDPDGSGPAGDTCSADGIGGIGDGGGGDGGGGDGGCFLTTAVVELRGETEGGPTLTALRAFRDGYMTRTAERRALVEEYYAVAPTIVAAISAGHAEWERIAGRGR